MTNKTTAILRKLDIALAAAPASVKFYHAALLEALRDETAPTPDWDAFPIARDFFIQRAAV